MLVKLFNISYYLLNGFGLHVAQVYFPKDFEAIKDLCAHASNLQILPRGECILRILNSIFKSLLRSNENQLIYEFVKN